MASDLHGFTEQETLNKVLNTSNDSLQVDIVDATGVSITTSNESVYADDADWTDTTSKHTLVGGLYQSTPQSITDGDTGPLQVNANGNLIVDLSATDNAVLDAMVVDLAAMEVLLTAANVDHAANEALLITIDADTSAIKTAVEAVNQAAEGTISATTQRVTIATDDDGVAHLATIAGAVSTQMQVDVVAISAQSDGTYIGDIKFGEALPAGSAAIGKLAANSGVDIGDVDVTSIIPATGATNLGKAIQSAQGSTDTGVAALVVRNDALADLSGADGDYAPLQVNKTGALNVTETTGHLGAIFEDGDTNTTSKQIIAIQFIEDTTFTTLTPVDSSYIGTASGNGDAIDTSNVFPQGMTIFGRWTGYRLASGTVVAYQGSW